MRSTASLLILLALAGCSGLHVSWTATASYNMPTAIQAGVIQPGQLAEGRK